jgi:uncharacterized iron-regulated membrane protein
MEVEGSGRAIDSLVLAEQVEERDPRVRVTHVPLAARPGESLSIDVEPSVDPITGRLYEPGYNQVFIDPSTGREIGRREWGQAWPLTRETLVSFLYKLHYSLHLPEMWGIDDWGEWLLGGVAIVWTVDCFIGFYLTMPAGRVRWWARWAPAWRIRTSGSAYRINFDIHRAFGLWTWLLLFVLAFTAFSLNLSREIFLPLMSLVSDVTPDAFDRRTPREPDRPIEPAMSFTGILALGRDEGLRRGWGAPAGSIFYSPSFGIHGVSFFEPGDDHGAAGVGPPMLFYDGQDGTLLGDRLPWKGTMADVFVQAQFPVHSGRILGLPGRILISAMGLVVAALSVTGVVIWYRKYRARSVSRV